MILVLAIALAAFIYLKNKRHEPAAAITETVFLPENFIGYWKLKTMKPDMTDKKGYLKIEDAGENKVNITSSIQFYYPKLNDTAFLEVFNVFAECASCVLKNEMPVTDKQIDVGAQKYVILKNNKHDTTLNAGINTSIPASITLHLINRDSIMIKVIQPDSVAASHGITILPFEYSFLFRKDL